MLQPYMQQCIAYKSQTLQSVSCKYIFVCICTQKSKFSMWRTCSADLLPGESVVQHLVLQWLCCHRHNGLSIAQHHYTTSCIKRTLCFVEKFASYLVSAHLFKRPTMQSNACRAQYLSSCLSDAQLTAVFLSVSSSAILHLC